METKEVKVRKSKETKRKEAQERQKAYNKLTAAQKIEKLNTGKYRAYKERSKLCDMACIEYEDSFRYFPVYDAIKAGR